ncbi:MAG: hypothetical protein V3R84_08940 [Acidimicrobiia bacterium]
MKKRFLAVAMGLLLVAGSVSGLAASEHDEATGDSATSPGQIAKATLLADFVAGDVAGKEDLDAASIGVATLRAMDIGWGALFKLYQYAAIMDMDFAALAAFIDARTVDGEFEFGFGELKKEMMAADGFADYDGPRNFGQLNSASKKAEKATEKMAERDARKAEKMAERDARKAEKMAERDARKAARGSDA